MEKMKAIVCHEFGPPDVLQLSKIDKPVPKDDELLIKVCATTVNAADCNTRGFTYIPPGLGFLARLMLGFKKPKISVLGSALAGEVVEAGKNVTSFRAGDRVFGTGPELGAYAEFACRPESGALAEIPLNTSYEEAAAVPYGGLTALHFLRDKGNIQKGQKVLIHGASGGVGSYAVQLARHFGAQVTGVCSTQNMEFVRSLGAQQVIDYTKEDFTQRDEKWDIILDVVVGKTSFSRCKSSLTPKGIYLAVAGGFSEMLWMIRTSLSGGRKVVFGGGSASEKKKNLAFLSELIEKGEIKPVVDRIFHLEEMADAHRYVEGVGKKGSVAVKVH